MNRKKIVSALVALALVVNSFGRAPSTAAPASNAPQLIVIGSDDNTNAEALRWMVDVLKGYTNYDGTPLRMSFYSNTVGANWTSTTDALPAAHNYAYKAGHEVSNHTETHPNLTTSSGRMSYAQVMSQIQTASDRLTNFAGVPKAHQFGFRTPFLAYTDTVFDVVEDFGFLYDCSVSEGNQQSWDGGAGNFYWPYKLATPNSSNQDASLFSGGSEYFKMSWGAQTEYFRDMSYAPGAHVRWSYHNQTQDAPIRQHSNLWELPCYNFNAPEPLASQIDAAKWGGASNEIGALDYNMWAKSNSGGFALNKQEALDVMKHTLDKMLAGNRTPMTIGVHSQYYFQSNEKDDGGNLIFPNITSSADRQWMFEEFVKYAVTKQNVWFVSGDMVIRYMENPVAAASFDPANYAVIPIDDGGTTTNTAPTNITLSSSSIAEDAAAGTVVGTLNSVDNAGDTHTYTLVSGTGFTVEGSSVKYSGGLTAGGKSITVRSTDQGGLSYDKSLSITVTAAGTGGGDFVDVLAENLVGWGIDQDSRGSAGTVNYDTSVSVTGTLNMVASDAANNDWAWISLSCYADTTFDAVTDVEVTYSSDKAITIAFGTDTYGYSADLAAGNNLTVKIPVANFTQSWGTAALNMSEIEGVAFEATEESATTALTVTSLKLYGFVPKGDTGTGTGGDPSDTVELVADGWGFYVYHDSTGDGGSAITSATGSEAMSFDLGTTGTYAGSGFYNDTNATFNLNGVVSINLVYNSTAPMIINLPMTGVTADWGAHQVILPASTGDTSVALNVGSFGQPEGATAATLDLSLVEYFSLQLADGETSGNIELKSAKLIYSGVVPVTSGNGYGAQQARAVVKGISGGKLNLSVPTAGNYEIALFTVDGRMVSRVNAHLGNGAHSIALNRNLAPGLMIVSIRGANNMITVDKLMIR